MVVCCSDWEQEESMPFLITSNMSSYATIRSPSMVARRFTAMLQGPSVMWSEESSWCEFRWVRFVHRNRYMLSFFFRKKVSQQH